MAILGKYIDTGTFSFTGAAMAGTPSFATVIHSIGAAPDLVWTQLASIEGVVSCLAAVLVPAATPGNASIVTLGFTGSHASFPTLAGDVYSMLAHSIIK